MAQDLKSVLTPSLFKTLAEARAPFSKSEPLDFNLVGQQIFGFSSYDSKIRGPAWPALVALSETGLDNVPDLMSFLPDPSSPEFPQQCFGLVELLDQAPRALFRGVDGRWIDAYFGVLSQRLADAWYALPAEQRPDAWPRWRDEVKVSFDYWVIVRFFFAAVFVHSESIQHQNIGLAMNEELRQLAESRTGETDPNRAERSVILSDTMAFAKDFSAGAPSGEDLTMQKWTFWFARLMDVHWPIINAYGRYPYRNAIIGRESTEEEKEWIEKTNHFAEASPEVAEHIRKDIAAGTWTPLGPEPRT
ncbi:hypothetical protein PT974_05383 [Cladobotryum mycophilum]|uniref:Uncharacterized protein n=1 Tax=Cladobotryum mycophilum TaxID=491253 RepID=A0ABR0SIL0_9HYPO